MNPSDGDGDGDQDPAPVDPDEQETVALADADADDNGEYSEEELTALTKAQLLTLAQTLEVGGVSSSNTKSEIIAAILAAQETPASPEDPDAPQEP